MRSQAGRLPYLRAIVANGRPIAWGTHTDDLARRSDVLGVVPLQVDIQVIRVDSFLWRQRQSIGEGIVPILDKSLQFGKLHSWIEKLRIQCGKQTEVRVVPLPEHDSAKRKKPERLFRLLPHANLWF